MQAAVGMHHHRCYKRNKINENPSCECKLDMTPYCHLWSLQDHNYFVVHHHHAEMALQNTVKIGRFLESALTVTH